jgi:cyanobactin maturation PatA/PatG family protease
VRPAGQLDLARAITAAVEAGADIVNISAGQKTDTLQASDYLEKAVDLCRKKGVLVVAAAGNDGCACQHIPAAMQTVLAVGAMDADGKPVDSSNWGQPYAENGLLAPGVDIPVAGAGGAPTTASGTSFATAVVAAVAARLLSAARAEGLKLAPADLKPLLLQTARPCDLGDQEACRKFLAGKLDAGAALEAVRAMARQDQAKTAAAPIAPQGPADDPHDEQRDPIPQHGPGAGEDRHFEVHQEQWDKEAMMMTDETFAPASPASEPAAAEGITPSAADAGGPAPAPAAFTPAAAPMPTSVPGIVPAADAVTQQGDCGCGSPETPQKVYALGALWFDFGTEARLDIIAQRMNVPREAIHPKLLIDFLKENPAFAGGVTITLLQEGTPIYALHPFGPFAQATYQAILEALDPIVSAKQDEVAHRFMQRVSIPGMMVSSTRLMNGMTVPVVIPDLRGMYRWEPDQLVAGVRAAAASAPGTGAEPAEDDIRNFLNRVYYELRNTGVTPEERAINFAATNAFQAAQVLADCAGRNLVLDRISVVKSPICRPDSDCWDVNMVMFDPENERRSPRTYRYTIDVSEVIPVTIGQVRSWAGR